jgi:hypothetical protein
MSDLLTMLALSGYAMLVIPTLVFVFMAPWISRSGNLARSKTGLLLLLAASAAALVMLNISIWANPYGREISSSLSAYGMLPVLVALLVTGITKGKEIAHLWVEKPVLLSALVILILGLFGLLWLAEAITVYIVVILTAITTLGWLVGTRAGLGWLAVLCLAVSAWLIIFSGGAFFVFGIGVLQWLRTGSQIITMLCGLLAIFLCAALLYAIVRPDPNMATRSFVRRLALIILLAAACAIPVFWDGMWSAAHSRAYEDHLPFVQFISSLTAGSVLMIMLRGKRRLLGLAFCAAITTICVLGLNWGWNTSAVHLTERRAARVEQAVEKYHLANGRDPSRLSELAPRYLLYLPPPVIVREGGWCYQGGDDFYRLGSIGGIFTYFEQDFQINVHAQAGDIPGGSWDCDQMLEMFMQGELTY